MMFVVHMELLGMSAAFAIGLWFVIILESLLLYLLREIQPG